MDSFHLFPPEASTSAAQVDWLFFGLVLMSLFFCAVVSSPDHLFFHSLPARLVGRPL